MEKRELAKYGATALVAAAFSIVFEFLLKFLYRCIIADKTNIYNSEELFVCFAGFILLIIVAGVIYCKYVKTKGNKQEGH